MSKVSVIMNSFRNDPDQLKQAIQSYLTQSEVKVELIISTVIGDTAISVVNDINNTLSIDIKLCITESPNIYNQLNNALKHCTGEWICYASGNDTAVNGKLILEVQECLSKNKLICYSAFNECDHLLNFVKVRSFHEYSYKKHLKGNFVNDCSMIHRSIIEKYAPYKGDQFGNMAHWDFWLRVFEGEGDVFCYNSIPTWNYRISPTSAHVKRQHDPELQRINNLAKSKMLSSHKHKIDVKCYNC